MTKKITSDLKSRPMKRTLIILLLSLSAFAQDQIKFKRPVHTFSIVARDPQTGDMGVAVQSHWFSVGQMVPWAEAGVGAIATQSFIDPSYGKLGLDMMRAGKSAPDVLIELLEKDKSRDVRQVSMIDAKGVVATFTGAKDIQAAGHELGSACGYNTRNIPQEKRTTLNCYDRITKSFDGGKIDIGSGFSVEANLMANDKVWPAMYDAYYASKGDLAERMLAALDAAQAAGGDIRGRQSAAIIVVKGKSSGKPWQDRIFDLRVDDSVEPLKELRRLVTLQRAYNEMNAGDLAVEHNDNEAALKHYSTAEQIMESAPNTDKSRLAEAIYWHAVALVTMKRVDESLPLFKRAFSLQPTWRELTPRLPKSGLLPDDAALVKRITSQ
jgi:uncharacterized Ntn-hydrolase superfamily protein